MLDPRLKLPTNTASRFLALQRHHPIFDHIRYQLLVTYADTAQSHNGTIYRADNWIQDHISTAHRTWTDPCSRPHPNRQVSIKSGPRTRTSDEMRSLGYVQSPAAPKLRFIRTPEMQ